MLYFDVNADWEKFTKLRAEINKMEKALGDINTTKSDAELDKLQDSLQEARVKMQEMVSTAALAGKSIEQGFERKILASTQVIQDYSQQIAVAKSRMSQYQTNVSNLQSKLEGTYDLNKKESYINSINDELKAIDSEKRSIQNLSTMREKENIQLGRTRAEYDLLVQQQERATRTSNMVGTSIKKTIVALGGFSALKGVAEKAVKTRMEFESMEVALKTLVGESKSTTLMGELKEMAKVSPLTLKDMVAAEKMMLGFGIDVNKSTGYLKSLMDVSMGDAGKFNSLTLAFSQMSAAGKLMGQDLNQMINAGFNPLSTISQQTGKSVAQLKEEMSKGAISAQMVQDAFVAATNAGGKFYGMSDNASKTVAGQISMLEDALDEMFNKLGSSAEGFMTTSLGALTKVVSNFEELAPVLAGVASVLGAAKVESVVYNKVNERAILLAKQLSEEKSTELLNGGMLNKAQAIWAESNLKFTEKVTERLKAQGKSYVDLTAAQKMSARMGTRWSSVMGKASKAMHVLKLASPWVALAAGIGLAVAAVVRYNREQKEIHAGEARAAKAMQKSAEAAKAEKDNLLGMQRELVMLKEGTEEYNKVKQDMVNLAAQYDPKLAEEINKTGLSASAYERLALTIDEVNKKRAAMAFVMDEQSIIDSGEKQAIGEMSALLQKQAAKKGANEQFALTTNIAKELADLQEGIKAGKVSIQMVVKGQGQGARLEKEVVGISKELRAMLQEESSMWRTDAQNVLIKYIETVDVSRNAIKGALESTGQTQVSVVQEYIRANDELYENIKEGTNVAKGSYKPEEIKNQLTEVERARTETEETINKVAASITLASPQERVEIEAQIKLLKARRDEMGTFRNILLRQQEVITGETFEQGLKRTKKAYDEANALVKSMSKGDVARGDVKKKDYEKAKADLAEAKKEYESFGGNTKEKDKNEDDKEAEAFRKKIVKQEDDNAETKIKAQEDGYKKEYALLEKQFADKKKALEDMSKELKELEVKLSTEEVESANKAINTGLEQNEVMFKSGVSRLIKDAIKGDEAADADGLKKEIRERYEQLMKTYEDILASLPEGDSRKGEVEQAKEAANKNMRAEVAKVDWDELMDTGGYQRIFDNLNNYSLTTLTSLKGFMEEYGGEISKNLSPADAESYYSALDSLNERISTLDPFNSIRESSKKYKEALVENKKALAKVKQAQEKLNAVKNSAAATDEDITQATKELREANEELAKSEDKKAKEGEQSKRSMETIMDTTTKLGEELANIGEQIGGTTGNIIGFTGQIISFVSSSVKSMQAVSAGATTALQAVEKASVILAIIGAAMQILQKLGSFLRTNEDKYNDAVSKQAEINKVKQAVRDYEQAVKDAEYAESHWFGNTGLDSLSKGYEDGKSALVDYWETANAQQVKYQNERGGGKWAQWIKDNKWVQPLLGLGGSDVGTSALIKNANKNIASMDSPSLVRAADNLRIETKSKKKGFLGIGARNQQTMGLQEWMDSLAEFDGIQLFDRDGMLNLEAANMILDGWGNKLVGETKETLEALKEAREQYDEWMKQLHEYVSSMYDPLTDTMVDALFNWLDTGEDVLGTFKDSAKDTFRSIAKEMIKSLMVKGIFDQYGEEIASVYEDLAAGNLSTEDAWAKIQGYTDSMMLRAEQQIPIYEEVLKAMDAASGGWLSGSTDDEQSATAGAFQTMSEDTAGVLEARATAVYESNLQIASEIGKLEESNRRSLNELLDAFTSCYLELRTIKQLVSSIDISVYSIATDMYSLILNTRKL